MKSIIIAIITFATLVGWSTSHAQTDDEIKKQIVKQFPQADSNQDGTLSEKEHKAARDLALKRFPQLDRDGDGELSVAEQHAMLKMAKARMTQKKGQSKNGQARGNKWGNNLPAPQQANVQYGDHQRHVLDLWMAESKDPTPLAIYIHGGGFTSGSKEKLREKTLNDLLAAGVSVAAINYRYRTIDPLPAAHHDARQALQFIRSKAKDWKIDKERVAIFGGSAGAQISMWLAFSDDMAKPDSKNPVERESTRVTCVATAGGQSSMEQKYWKQHLATFGIPFDDKEFLSRFKTETVDEAEEIARSISAIPLMTSDDPPIFMSYGFGPDKKPPSQQDKMKNFILHHVQFGIDLKKKADEVGVENHLSYPGSNSHYRSNVKFLVDKLTAKK